MKDGAQFRLILLKEFARFAASGDCIFKQLLGHEFFAGSPIRVVHLVVLQKFSEHTRCCANTTSWAATNCGQKNFATLPGQVS